MKKKAKDTKASYILQVQNQYKEEIMTGMLHIIIFLYFWDARRRDRDNWHKISMDALEWIVYLDDSQIQMAVVNKRIDRENPRIEILIQEV